MVVRMVTGEKTYRHQKNNTKFYLNQASLSVKNWKLERKYILSGEKTKLNNIALNLTLYCLSIYFGLVITTPMAVKTATHELRSYSKFSNNA